MRRMPSPRSLAFTSMLGLAACEELRIGFRVLGRVKGLGLWGFGVLGSRLILVLRVDTKLNLLRGSGGLFGMHKTPYEACSNLNNP